MDGAGSHAPSHLPACPRDSVPARPRAARWCRAAGSSGRRWTCCWRPRRRDGRAPTSSQPAPLRWGELGAAAGLPLPACQPARVALKCNLRCLDLLHPPAANLPSTSPSPTPLLPCPPPPRHRHHGMQRHAAGAAQAGGDQGGAGHRLPGRGAHRGQGATGAAARRRWRWRCGGVVVGWCGGVRAVDRWGQSTAGSALQALLHSPCLELPYRPDAPPRTAPYCTRHTAHHTPRTARRCAR